MAIAWGAWTERDTYYMQRLGIDLSLSGTTITARYYVETTGSISQSARALSRNGAVTGNVDYAWSESGSGVKEITAAKDTVSGTRGATYTFGASFPLFWGGTASVSNVKVSVPALAPSKPSVPSVSGIGTTAFSASVTPPAANGSPINLYTWEWATNAAYTSGKGSTTSTTNSRGFTGFIANTGYYLRTKARNTIGTGPVSDAAYFKMKPNAPAPATGVTATRASDTSHSVKWTNKASLTSPWDTITVARWDNVSNVYSTLTSSLAGNATAYTDTSTRADRQYRYRVEPKNSAGTAAAAYSNYTYVKPAAANGQVVTRTSDTSHTIKWTAKGTSAAPWDSQILTRWDNVSNAWATLSSTLSGTTTTYTDSSTRADRQYRYRLQSKNSAGTSDYAYTGYTVTTPAGPSSANATKQGDNIVVDFVPTTSYAAQHEVYNLPAGGAWTLLDTLAAGVKTYTHVGPSKTVTHQYRVRAKSAGPTLYSGYATTAVVQLAAPPTPPTVAATKTADIFVDAPIRTTWKHNPTDSSAQRKYQVRHRPLGATAWTTGAEVAGTGTSISWVDGAPYVNGQIIEVEVRTWGVHADPSGYSATSTVRFSTRPTVTINAPGADYHSPTLAIEWEFYQSESLTQAAWRAELVDAAGAIAESKTGSGTTSATTFAYVMPDQTTWSVRVLVQSGVGLWSDSETIVFTVDYPEPVDPSITAVFNKVAGTMELDVYNPPVASDMFTVTNHIPNGSFELPAGMVEVWRNLAYNPFYKEGLSSIRITSTNVCATFQYSQEAAGVRGVTITRIETSGFTQDRYGSLSEVGSFYAVRFSLVALSAEAEHMTIRVQLHNNSTSLTGDFLATLGAIGEPVEFNVPAKTASLGTGALFLYEDGSPSGVTPVGTAYLLGNVTMQKVRVAGEKVHGPTFDWADSPDSDLTTRAIGPVGGSPSVAEGTIPSGLSGPYIGIATIQSSDWKSNGEFSLRQTPNVASAVGALYSEISLTTAGVLATAFAGKILYARIKLRILAPLTGSIGVSRVLRLMVSAPSGDLSVLSGAAPNLPGDYDIAVNALIPADATLVRVLWYHGGMIGSGDLWWDDLIVSNQPSDFFDGYSQSHTTQDGYAVTYAFEGDPYKSPSVATYSAAAETITNWIYRQVNNGEWVLITKDVPPQGSFTDHIPSIAGVNRYKAIAWSDLPSAAESAPVEVITQEPGWVYVNYGPAFSEMVRLWGNVKLSGSSERSRSLVQFAGRRRKVAFFGEAGSQAIKVAGRLTPDASPLEEWEDAIFGADVVCFRDPKGRRIFGALGGFGHVWESPKLVAISFDVEEVDHRESDQDSEGDFGGGTDPNIFL